MTSEALRARRAILISAGYKLEVEHRLIYSTVGQGGYEYSHSFHCTCGKWYRWMQVLGFGECENRLAYALQMYQEFGDQHLHVGLAIYDWCRTDRDREGRRPE